MILEWDDGTSGVPSMCSSMPTCQPSIALRHASAVRAGERGLQHGRSHGTCRRVFI